MAIVLIPVIFRGPTQGESRISVPDGTIDVSPDGRWLLVNYFTDSNEFEIGIVDLTSESPVMDLYRSGPNNQNPIGFDPSGKFILYNDSASNLDNMFLARFPDTGDRWRIGTRDMQYHEYNWAADGSGIYIRNSQELSFLSIELENGVSIADQRGFIANNSGVMQENAIYMSVHPDGDRTVILVSESNEQTVTQAQIIFRNDWFAEIERIMSRQ